MIVLYETSKSFVPMLQTTKLSVCSIPFFLVAASVSILGAWTETGGEENNNFILRILNKSLVGV